MEMYIRVNLDNAAFFPPRPEVCRILRDLADEFEKGEETVSILDINGNKCGRITYSK